MTRQTLIIIGICTLVATTLGFSGQGREIMTLDGGKTGSVEFKHHLHQSVVGDCQVCHSSFPQKEGALAAAKEASKLKKKQVMNKTCIKCHRAEKKAGNASGPVSCKACHKR
ncbi:MAG: cytochrome c3 family protein [Desulfobacter sp.]|nr:cytochrome c3 family protein [Desulfobacter sp.]